MHTSPLRFSIASVSLILALSLRAQTLSITSINPAAPTRSTTAQFVTILGSGFQPGLTVFATDPTGLQNRLGPAVSVSSASFSISVTFSREGSWTLFVVNPGETLSNHFQLTVGCNPSDPGVLAPRCGAPFGPQAMYLAVASASNGCEQFTPQACAGVGPLNLGLQFQCVEYARRVIAAIDSSVDTSNRNAIDFWRNPPAKFVKFNNYGLPPKAGDILVWSTLTGRNRFGHIAVVADALPLGDPTSLSIVEQNWSLTGRDTMTVTKDGLGNYSILNNSAQGYHRSRSHALLGWLRLATPAVLAKPFASQPLVNGPFTVEVVDSQLNPTPAPADISVTALRQVISQCSGILFSSTRTLSIPQGQAFATVDAAGRDPACNTLPIRTRWTIQQAIMAPDNTVLDLSTVPSQQLTVEIIR
jgi:CHAP domain